jgi:hypothetical protein
MVPSAVLASVIVDDHFDDGVIGTNTTGIGTGFNTVGLTGGSVTESDSSAHLINTTNGAARAGIASKEGASLAAGISRFEFRGVSFARNTGNTGTGSTGRTAVGVRGNGTAEDVDAGVATGFWIQFESGDIGETNASWSGTSTLFYESSTHVKTVLATWKFDTLNWDDNNSATMNFTPVLDVTLDLSPAGYSLTIKGDTISNVTGSLSGSYASAGITNELTTGHAFAFNQGEAPGLDMSVHQIVIMEDAPPPVLASLPNPEDDEKDVIRDVILRWTPGPFASTHDVYLGTSFDDVTNATRAEPLGLLVSKDQSDTTYNPGPLAFGKTYYWRVDEVNAPSAGGTIYKGDVWSFTVEPYSIAIPDVNATASSSSDATTGPEKTVDGSGLDPDDQHSTTGADMWLSAKGVPFPHWIQYEFDKVYKLDEMWVWNSNQTLESIVGLGAENVAVQYSTNGADWTDLGDFVFAKASGAPSYTANTQIAFGGVPAKYVKLTISSNWGHIFPQAGLSEVRFFYIPVAAREPSPAPGSTNLHPQVALSWRAGREADSHDVYLGTDSNAVADGTILPATTSQAKYEVPLDLEQTYYWKVVEVNQAETPSTWASDVWSFSTATYISVDDFESYTNDSPKRVFQTWIDGGGFSPDESFPSGGSGNGTGSYAGYDPLLGDIMETSYFYGGRQSMPLYYDNSAAPKISEAVRTLDPAKDTTDWTKHGLTTLVLWFRGDPANATSPLYVKINNTKKLYNNGVAATTTEIWKPFQIDLASVPASDLKNVKTITIGVGDGSAGGTGTILIDEIRLYATAPQIAVPTDPGTSNLEVLYSMEGDVKDSSGKGRDGTANGDPGYVDGPAGYGQALAFDGTNDYVDLPIGNLLSTLGGSTFAAWVNFAGTGGVWQRVFDFGTGTTVYMYLTPSQGSGTMRFAITTNSNGAESGANGPIGLPSGWHHAAVVLADDTMRIRLYMDGTQVASGTTALLPRNMGVTNQNWLGRSQWPDPYFNGSIDDFRIYSRALSDGEVLYLAGDR